MGRSDVPQPDVSLRILPEWGVQSGEAEGGKYGGAPELIVEATGSSRSRDLGVNREIYRSSGVWNGKLLDVAERGLQSPEHAAFVKRLASAHRRK